MERRLGFQNGEMKVEGDTIIQELKCLFMGETLKYHGLWLQHSQCTGIHQVMCFIHVIHVLALHAPRRGIWFATKTITFTPFGSLTDMF